MMSHDTGTKFRFRSKKRKTNIFKKEESIHTVCRTSVHTDD